MVSKRFKGATEPQRVKFKEFEGSLLLVTPKSKGESDYEGTPSPYTKSDVVVLDGDFEGQKHKNVWVFGAYLQGQLDPEEGTVLGRLVKSKEKIGKGKPWILDEPTKKDVKRAESYFDSLEDEEEPDEDEEDEEEDDEDETPPWKKNKK